METYVEDVDDYYINIYEDDDVEFVRVEKLCTECDNIALECICVTPLCECAYCYSQSGARCSCKVAEQNGEIPCLHCMQDMMPSVTDLATTLMNQSRDEELELEKSYVWMSTPELRALSAQPNEEHEGARILRILNWVAMGEKTDTGYRVGYVSITQESFAYSAKCAKCGASTLIQGDLDGLKTILTHALKHGSYWDRLIPEAPLQEQECSMQDELIRNWSTDEQRWWQQAEVQEAYIRDLKRGRVTYNTRHRWLKGQIRKISRKWEKALSERPVGNVTFRQQLENWIEDKDTLDEETISSRNFNPYRSNNLEREVDYWNTL